MSEGFPIAEFDKLMRAARWRALHLVLLVAAPILFITAEALAHL
jgi:hypothetical protein